MSTVSFAAPRGWTAVTLGEDRAQAIDAAVDALASTAHPDADGAAQRWLRERLVAATEVPPGARCDVVGLLVASAPVAGVTLPLSAQILRLHDGVMAGDPWHDLALLAAQDASATPVVVGGAVSLRTHAVGDVASAVRDEVEVAAIGARDRAAILDGLAEVPSLRVRYYLPGLHGTPWHVVAFTALLGRDDVELRTLYLDLCDTFMQSMRVAPDVA
ncbi:hypothetical protein [uncultured Demequina sp.]|uniref:hypothetical protein n=1 Tax=uncultured Demequina sp. TaxID=693499 RepID=UPI0025FD3A5C|nr:hypothetical protein [uncultured Demequina sp.]